MSVSLPVIDLTGAVAGDVYTIPVHVLDFQPLPLDQNNYATVQILNESPCELAWQTISEGHSGYIGAGGWKNLNVIPGETGINITVDFVLPGVALVYRVYSTYYYAGETPDVIGNLGNSPVGGSTSLSGNTLSNEGNAAGGLVIDIGDAAIAKLWQVFTNTFNISVDQSGVAHTVLQGMTSGHPLAIGQAGDISDILGMLNIDGGTVTKVGSITGTCTMTQLLAGFVKLLVIEFGGPTGYNDAANQDFLMPVPFTTSCFGFHGNLGTGNLIHSGVAVTNVGIFTSLSTGGGTTSPVQNLKNNQVWQYDGPWDTYRYIHGGSSKNVLVAIGV